MADDHPTLLDHGDRAWWLFPDGTKVPAIRGGSDDGTTGGEGDASSATGDGDGSDGDGALGAAGEKALSAFKERARTAEREAKELRTQLDGVQEQLDQLRQGQLSDHERALEAARTEAADAARAEVDQRYRGRLDAAAVRSAAGKFADPEDAMRYLDLSAISRTDDGDLDPEDLAAQLSDVLKAKPYLAGATSHGSADGGARGGAAEPTLDEQIEAAKAAGNTRLALQLTNRKLAELGTA